jgi:hypothetical protein
MPTPRERPARSAATESWLQNHVDLTAFSILLLGLLARLWAAFGTFLNPDEALHFRLANQPSWLLAYRQSLTASHPPLLTFVLYWWRAFGTSELWLRLPSVLAGVAFCWIFYKWLSSAAGDLVGLIGLIFVSFLPPIVMLSAEIRQYALLLAFLAGALYFLDDSFAKSSRSRMAAFCLCLYLGMLSHYSAFLFAAALAVYALFRFFTARLNLSLIMVWVAGQLGALALAIFLYKTHISKLGAGESRTALQGWMSEFFLRHSYFDSAHDNPLVFLVGHSFGVFQYFFGQLAVGDAMGLLFVAGVVLLLRGKGFSSETQSDSRRLGIFLLLPFAIAGGASLAHVYPYGGTRHIAFLVIPGVAGVAIALARLMRGRPVRAIALAVLIVAVCIVTGKQRQPYIPRAEQARSHIDGAIAFLRQNATSHSLIFTDYESELILGHFLCQQKPITFETSSPDFEAFSCQGVRVVSASYKTATLFDTDNFLSSWKRLMDAYRFKTGDTIWIFQAGWRVNLLQELKNRYEDFHNLRFAQFGRNIVIFTLRVGQPMPEVPEPARFISPIVDPPIVDSIPEPAR